jgi:ribosome biogenesis GTPase / thiamine phosphate phosphatase
MAKHRNSLSKNLTDDFLSGAMDEDRAEGVERFGQRSKHHEKNKAARTAAERQERSSGAFDTLPLGRVIQVFSRFCEVVADDGSKRLCGTRKTIGKLADARVVVGDRVRFVDQPTLDANGNREGIIERIEPRDTILTRADSFKARENAPIVANAHQMLIVASIVQPAVRWGLIDRMLVAAQSGKLRPIVCLNKTDLATEAELADGRDKLDHYRTLGITCVETSVTANDGIDALRDMISKQVTVLAGHSGVGKSSLVTAIEPGLDIRVGEISLVNDKGKHTTTSARIYPLAGGGDVIDTPGVKLFGLWQVSPEDLAERYFPDVDADIAPAWRVESFERILASLNGTKRS